jgi:transposase
VIVSPEKTRGDTMPLITLSYREGKALANMVVRTKTAVHLRRAQALLWLDAGERLPEVATRLRVSRRTIYNWVARFRGSPTLDLTTRLSDGIGTGRPRTAQGIIDPLIRAVIDRDPRELGYRSTVWTAPLLTHDLAAQHSIAVSRQSVSLAIARVGLRWKRPRHDLARRALTWRQAKGGSNAAWRGGSGRSS